MSLKQSKQAPWNQVLSIGAGLVNSWKMFNGVGVPPNIRGMRLVVTVAPQGAAPQLTVFVVLSDGLSNPGIVEKITNGGSGVTPLDCYVYEIKWGMAEAQDSVLAPSDGGGASSSGAIALPNNAGLGIAQLQPSWGSRGVMNVSGPPDQNGGVSATIALNATANLSCNVTAQLILYGD